MKNKGFIALISVIVVGSIILIVGVSVAITSVLGVDMVSMEQKGKQALALANSCISLAINRSMEISNYEGRERFSVGDYFCNILDVSTSSIVVKGVSGGTVKNIEVTINDVFDGLIGWWRLNEGSGVVAKDFSLEANAGTLTNSPSWVTDKNGTAFRALGFDADSESVVINHDEIFNSSEITYSFWFQVNRDVNASDSTMVAYLTKGTGGSNSRGPMIYSRRDRNYIGIFMDTTSGDLAWKNDWVWTKGQWHFLAITISETAGELKVYKDGVFSKTLNFTGDLAFNSGNLYLGANASASSEVFKIDDVRIYDRVLSQTEIESVMTSSHVWSLLNN